VSTSGPLNGRAGHDSSSDNQKDGSNTTGFVPHRHPTLHRQNLTQEELIAIRDTAARIADHCAVRDDKSCLDSSAQETLQRIRSSVWSEKVKNDRNEGAEPAPSKQEQDDNGVSVTDDGCIIQRGFDISPMTSSPVDTI
jgi:hypothetical protein